jgi:RNA polymerase sigma factor for flagellar operon FliA
MANQEQTKLLETYTYLVHRIVASFCKRVPKNVLKEDMTAAGMMGLWDAIQRHSGDDAKFPWYAQIRIRGAILDDLRSQDWLPRNARWLLAEQTGLAVMHLEDISEPEQNKALCVEDESVEENRKRQQFQKALRRLSSRERSILVRHTVQGVKFAALAEEYRVSVPRISQVHSRAAQKLQSYMSA